VAALRPFVVPGRPRLRLDLTGPETGTPVFFLHGIGGNRTSWADEMAAFGGAFRCAAWDARGYGESEDYDGPLDFSDFARDLARSLDALGAARAHLVGLSMGGRIAQDFAFLYPARVATLALVATIPGFAALAPDEQRRFVESRLKPLREGKTPAEIAPDIARGLLGPTATEAVYRRLVASMAALHVESYMKTVEASTRFDRRGALAAIRAPTLLIFGSEDRLYKPEIGRVMQAAIPGAALVVVPGAGHLVNLEAPAAFAAALRPFLERHHDAADGRR
jgi:3-oxoadipate enol-lactonase